MVIKEHLRANFTATTNENPVLGDVPRDSSQEILFSQLDLVESVQHDISTSKTLTSVLDEHISILSREFHIIHSETFSSSASVTYPVTEIFEFEEIQNVLKLYSYLVFDGVRIRIILKTLPQQFGLVTVDSLPLPATYDASNETRGLGKKHDLLSISSQDSLDIVLPWVCCCSRANLLREEISDFADTRISKMWRLRIATILGEVFTSDPSAPVTIGLHGFASLVNPRVSIPRMPRIPEPPLNKKRVIKRKVLKSVAQMEPNMLLTPKKIAAAFTGLGATATAWNGMFKQAKDSVEAITELKDNLGEAASTVSDAFTLKKDVMTHQEQTEVTQDLFGHIGTMTPGVGKTLSADYPPPLPPEYFGDPKWRHSLINIMRENPAPHYVWGRTFVTGQSQQYPISPANMIWGSTVITTAGFYYYFAQFFKWWSGSVELSFVIETSAFGSATLTFQYEHFTSFTEQADPANMHRIATITRTVKGKAVVTLNVPFMREYPRSRTNIFKDINLDDEIFVCPGVTVTCEQVSSQVATPKVLVLCYIRPGVDFRYMQPQDGKYDKPPPPEFTSDAQISTSEIFSSVEHFPTFPIPKPLSWTTTAEDMMSLWSARQTRATPPLIPYAQDRRIEFQDPAFILGTYDMIAQCFLFNSGSLTFKYGWETDTTAQCGYPNFNPENEEEYFADTPTDGKSYGKGAFRPVDTIDAPWYEATNVYQNERHWESLTHYNAMHFYTDAEETSNFEFFWVKAGPSFQVFHLVPPPFFADWPWHIIL